MFNIRKIVSGIPRLLTYGPMEGVAAAAGTPIFTDLKSQQSEDKKALEANILNKKRSFFQILKDSFTYGVVASVVGLIGWVVTGKFLRDDAGEDGKPGPQSFVKGWLTKIFGLLAIGGVALSVIAQRKGLHVMKALGPEQYRKTLFEAIEKEYNLKIFKELSVDDLMKEAKHSSLEYNPDHRDLVLNAPFRDNFKLYLTGDAGTGKTAGAKYIAGAYAARKAKQGSKRKVKVLQFNSESLREYLKKQEEKQGALGTAFGMVSEQAQSLYEDASSAWKHDPLVLANFALERIKDLKKEADNNGEDLIVILDEIHSIINLDELKQGKYNYKDLVALVESLKELMEREDDDVSKVGKDASEVVPPLKVICTSNHDINYFRKIPVDEKTLAGLVEEGGEKAGGRLNGARVYISRPDSDTLARMIANYLLFFNDVMHSDKGNIFDKSINEEIQRGQDRGLSKRDALAQLIRREIASDPSCNKLVGRHVVDAICDVLDGNYEAALEKSDNPKDIKISLDMVHSVLQNKQAQVYIGDGARVQGDTVASNIISSLLVSNPQTLSIFARNLQELQEPGKHDSNYLHLIGILFNGFYTIQPTDQGDYYLIPKNSHVTHMPEVNSVKYLHALRIVPPKEDLGNRNKWTVEICFKEVTNKDIESKRTVEELILSGLGSLHRSKPYTGNEFYEMVTSKFIHYVEQVSEGGKKEQEGGINIGNLLSTALDVGKQLGFDFRGLAGGLLGGGHK